MKKRQFEKELRKLDWWLEEHGGRHDTWTNGAKKTSVARHAEIPEWTGRAILKFAKQNPGPGGKK